MTEDKGFLERWSERKRAARDALTLQARAAGAVAEPVEAAPSAPEIEPEIDPADLPPLDSIRAGADVQAFLQQGVPKAMKQAALRRLWSADPKIREFREVADYDWDFNAPGYGALLPHDDPKAAAEKVFAALRRKVVAEPKAREATEATAAQPDVAPTVVAHGAERPTAAETEPPRSGEAPTVTEATPSAAPAAGRRRRHGAATPI